MRGGGHARRPTRGGDAAAAAGMRGEAAAEEVEFEILAASRPLFARARDLRKFFRSTIYIGKQFVGATCPYISFSKKC